MPALELDPLVFEEAVLEEDVSEVLLPEEAGASNDVLLEPMTVPTTGRDRE